MSSDHRNNTSEKETFIFLRRERGKCIWDYLPYSTRLFEVIHVAVDQRWFLQLSTLRLLTTPTHLLTVSDLFKAERNENP